jgi:hypothetical protein
MNSSTRYMWHHQLHEAWASERLYFWRLAFFPTYDERLIRESLEQMLGEYGVLSYALYETYGLYDLILRIWLPTKTPPEKFEEALTAHLSPFHMEVCDAFSVGQILRHWPWLEADGSVRSLSSRRIAERPADSDLAALNTVAEGAVPDEATATLLAESLEQGLLAECPAGNGIKFLVVVTSSSQLATIAARGQLRRELLLILKDAEEEGAVEETSLYEGSGFGQFILLGRIAPEEFSFLRTGIIDRVNAAGTGTFFRARPYTYITAGGRSDGTWAPKFVDKMSTIQGTADASQSLEDLLNQDESETLEMKASAFVNVDRWIQSGKASADEGVLNGGVLRALVGMLNRRGGTVILGTLEPGRVNRDDILKKRSVELLEIGKYLCLGVALDYQGKDWDQYALKLQSVIMKRIDPPPVGLITISKVEVMGKPLCVLSVQRTTREWFYLRREKDGEADFLVRLGNSTRLLNGPVADGYKQSNSRG